MNYRPLRSCPIWLLQGTRKSQKALNRFFSTKSEVLKLNRRVANYPGFCSRQAFIHGKSSLLRLPVSSEVNPALRKPKILILCFDGTSNEFDEVNTNVVKLFSMLDKSDTSRQLVYYQTGIGTYGPPGIVSSIGLWVASVLDHAFAWYLEAHVMSGYKFIMDNYESGDQICLFGFSRGAYTARALAAMLYKVGLLPRCNGEHIPFAWKIFRESKKEYKYGRDDVRRWHSLNFKKTFSRSVEIDFLGIWDTVTSVGLRPQTLANTVYNPIVKKVAHAISLDEVRAKFRSNLWNPPPIVRGNGGSLQKSKKAKVDQNDPTIPAVADYAALAKDNLDIENRRKERSRKSDGVNEVWFAGDHCDVGGGHTTYTEEHALSHIPLRWMVREAIQCTNIIFDPRVLKIYGISPKLSSSRPTSGRPSIEPPSSYPIYRDSDGSLESYRERERKDALSKAHSAFTKNGKWFWRFLEVMPLPALVEFWGKQIYFLRKPNWWSPRETAVRTDGVKVKIHSSVKTRLEHLKDETGETYQSKAIWDPNNVEWVDEWALPETGETQSATSENADSS